MCEKQRCFSFWVFACLLSCLPLAMPWAEEMNIDDQLLPFQTQDLRTIHTGTSLTDPWASFDLAWTSLKQELTQWSEDSLMLYALLEALQTEADGLRSSLMLSTEQLLASETARLEERQATELLLVAACRRADEADKKAAESERQAEQASSEGKRWRRLAFGAAGIGALGWITAWIGLR